MNDLLPLFLLLCLGVGALRRAPVYDAFVEGAKEGLKTAWQILPSLLAMLCPPFQQGNAAPSAPRPQFWHPSAHFSSPSP